MIRHKVLMGVTEGGYTGQRDQYEKRETERQVNLVGENQVELVGTQMPYRSVVFSLDDLQQAVETLKRTEDA